MFRCLLQHLQGDHCHIAEELFALYHPTNAHNLKNVELLKHIKIMDAAPTCFDLQRNHHQAATASA